MEYSNSSGAVVHCRPDAPGATVAWRLVHSVPDDEQELARAEHQVGGARGGPRARLVRQDGALVLAPFAAAHFRPEVHSANYRCCASNALGTACSGPVRVRAGE